MALRPMRIPDFVSLTKPDVNLLIGLTTAAGYCLGASGQDRALAAAGLTHTVVGTVLVASGSATMNQLMERNFDALMHRTAHRPLAAGRIRSSSALAFGVALLAGGAIELAMAVNNISAAIALATMAVYLFIYTPLKRRTSWCTVIGAVSGAAPPLIGWAAATGSLTFEAWVLYAMVFLWQFPHVMAIGWMYRTDYRRAGFRIAPPGEAGARYVLAQATGPLFLLVPVTLVPVFIGRAGPVYLAAALILGAAFIHQADRLAIARSNAMARRLLFASIVYLSLILTVLMLDQVIPPFIRPQADPTAIAPGLAVNPVR
jgi:protoheme IX farnesyltransferase